MLHLMIKAVLGFALTVVALGTSAQTQALAGTQLPAQFAGFGPNDTIDKAHQLLGRPASEEVLGSSKMIVSKWPEKIRVVSHPATRKILIVALEGRAAVEKLKAAGVQDRVFEFIGMPRDKALQILGPPTYSHASAVEWSIKEGRREIAVFKMYCPAPSLLSPGGCEDMSVSW